MWNTGEALTVTDSGTYLSAQMAGGQNNTATSLSGLVSLGGTPGNEFTLPNGVVIPQPLTSNQLANFANAWRVPQQFSLLDYAPGETTASFTDLAFPRATIDVTALPADVLAKAAAVVAAAGITDPGVARAASFDYIASGGNLSFVATDASLLSGVTTVTATITPSGPAVAAIGVLPAQAAIRITGPGTTPIPFEV